MQSPTNSTENKSSWDVDFDAMDQNPTSAIDAEIVGETVFEANIKRPTHKSPPLKMIVLFSGSAIIVTGVAFAFFGNSFSGGEQQAKKTPKPAATNTLSTSDQERLANAEAANVMGGGNKAFEAHNSQDKKEDSTPAKTPDTAKQPPPEAPKPPIAETPKQSAPVVVASKPVEVHPAPKSVVYQQPTPRPLPVTPFQPTKVVSNNNQDARIKSLESKMDKLGAGASKEAPVVVASKPVETQPAKPGAASSVVYQQPAPVKPFQPTKVVSNNNQDARIKLLESKVDKLGVASPVVVASKPVETQLAKLVKPASEKTMQLAKAIPNNQDASINSLERKIYKLEAALEKQSSQQKQIKEADNSTIVATKPPLPSKETLPTTTSQIEKPQTSTAPQPQIQQVVQTTSPAIDGRATAKLFDSITISSIGNISNSVVRTQLTQPIPTSNGMEIPAGSIVAMNIAVASNGMVTGSSIGVWDVKSQKQINIPAGSLALEGLKGQPLLAQSIKPNDGGAQAADTQAAIWGAVGAGVDGLTRPDSNSTVTAGTIVTSSTSGGSRDVLVNAAGGFAKSKAASLEREAAKRRDKISAQAELWHLPQNTEVVISARPPMITADSRYNQTSSIINGQHQYNAHQPEEQPPIPVVDSRYSPTSKLTISQQYQPNNNQSEVYQTEARLIPNRYAANSQQLTLTEGK